MDDERGAAQGPWAGRLFSIAFPGTFLDVRRVLLDIQDRLTNLNVSSDVNGSVQIVLAEVLNNVVEHAFAVTSGEIIIQAVLKDQVIWFEIADNGAAMPGGRLPAGRMPDLDLGTNDLPEGGFGWLLIHDLTRDLDYRRDKDRNILTLTISLIGENR